jgi:transcriptional regulator with XRE-family HTH domain
MNNRRQTMIGAKVKELRVSTGIGSRELSRAVGMAETYVSQLERGLIKNPDRNVCMNILNFLGLDEEQTAEILNQYELKVTPKSINTLQNSVLTNENLSRKAKEDAEQVYNFIQSLPDITKQYLMEMLKNDI